MCHSVARQIVAVPQKQPGISLNQLDVDAYQGVILFAGYYELLDRRIAS